MGLDYAPNLDALSSRLAALEAALPTMASDLAAKATSSDITSAITSLMSNAAPPSVGSDDVQGDSARLARQNHTHAARVQRTIVTLNGSGEATWTFGKMFTAKPAMTWMVVEASDTAQPVFVKVKSWTMGAGADSAKYAAVTVKAYRAQTIPQNLVTLLVGAVFNIFGGSAPNGVEVHLSAGEQM